MSKDDRNAWYLFYFFDDPIMLILSKSPYSEIVEVMTNRWVELKSTLALILLFQFITCFKLYHINNFRYKYLQQGKIGQQFKPLYYFSQDKLVMDGKSKIQQYREYPYRIVIVVIYSLSCVVNGMCWAIVTPISVLIASAYQISAAEVSLIPMSFLVFYVIFNFPSNWIIDEKGIKLGVVIGTMATGLGCAIRCLVGLSFNYVIVGQVFCAIGQPFLTNAAMKIGTRWFLPKNSQRAVFMTILSVVTLVGGAIGFFIPAVFVSDQDMKEQVRDHFYYLQFFTATLGTISTILIMIFFKESPPTLPSIASMTENTSFKESFRVLFNNRNFLSLATSFGIINGVFNVYGSVMGDILDPHGFRPDDVSVFGTVQIIFGIVGALLCGAYVERTFKYRNVFWCISIIGISLSIMFPWAIREFSDPSKYYWVFFFLVGFQGLIYVPSQPMTIDYGIDTMFPVGEAQITGFMLSLGQIFGIIFVKISQQLFGLGNPTNNPQQRKTSSLKTITFTSTFLIIGCIILMFQNSELKRSKLQRNNSQTQQTQLISSE